MSFLPSSAASSVNTPSIAGWSSLLPLLSQSSTLALEFVQTPEGAAFLAKVLEGSLDPAHPSYIPHTATSSEKEPTAAQGLGSQRADKLPFSHFVRLIRGASPTIRALPVITIESYQHGGKNAGLLPHRYSLLTILHPTGGPPTYIKLHMRAIQDTLASVLTAELADDRAALVRPTDRRLAALSSTSTTQGPQDQNLDLAQGPSLDALAALLDIIDKRVGKYDVHARNCLWLADLVLFGCARKFRAHWLGLTDGSESESKRRAQCTWFPDGAVGAYLRGEADVMTATARCFLPEGWPWWLGNACAVLGTAVGAFDMQHEVEDVVGKWRDFVGAAVPQAAGVGVAGGAPA